MNTFASRLITVISIMFRLQKVQYVLQSAQINIFTIYALWHIWLREVDNIVDTTPIQKEVYTYVSIGIHFSAPSYS